MFAVIDLYLWRIKVGLRRANVFSSACTHVNGLMAGWPLGVKFRGIYSSDGKRSVFKVCSDTETVLMFLKSSLTQR